MLLFTHHYPARYFGYVTENGVNSNWKIANWEGVCYDRTDGERL